MLRSGMCAHVSFLLLVAVSVIGCGDGVKRPPTFPVTGTVLYNGSPVEDATVSFMGEGASRAGTGVTDAEGNFSLSTYGANDGAVPGAHKITVTKADPNAPAAASAADSTAAGDPLALGTMMEQDAEAKESGQKPLIPLKYADTNSSTLSETVSDSGENVFVLQLTD